MAVALLEAKLGLLFHPSGPESAQATWREDIAAGRHRDKVLAYGLHFAQRFLAVGRPDTALELLDACVAARDAAGIVEVDRRLIALRPHILAARVEALQCESAALELAARSAGAATSASAGSAEAARAATDKRAELQAAETILHDARREERRVEATLARNAGDGYAGGFSPSSLAQDVGRMSLSGGGLGDRTTAFTLGGGSRTLGGGTPRATGHAVPRASGFAPPRAGAPPLASAVGDGSLWGAPDVSLSRPGGGSEPPPLSTPSRGMSRPHTAPSSAATPINSAATAQSASASGGPAAAGMSAAAATLQRPSSAASLVTGVGGGPAGECGAGHCAVGGSAMGSAASDAAATDGARSIRGWAAALEAGAPATRLSFGGRLNGTGACGLPAGASRRRSLGGAPAPPSALRQRYNIAATGPMNTPPTVKQAAPVKGFCPGGISRRLGGDWPSAGIAAGNAPPTPNVAGGWEPGAGWDGVGAAGSSPRLDPTGITPDVSSQLSEWKRQAAHLRRQTDLLVAALPPRVRRRDAAQASTVGQGGKTAASGVGGGEAGALDLMRLEPWIFTYMLTDPPPPPATLRPAVLRAAGLDGELPPPGLWDLELQPSSGPRFCLTLRLFSEAAPATVAMLDDALASEARRALVQCDRAGPDSVCFNLAPADSSRDASCTPTAADQAAVSAVAVAAERTRLSHTSSDLVSVLVTMAGGARGGAMLTKFAVSLGKAAPPLGENGSVVGRAVDGLSTLADVCGDLGGGGSGALRIVGWSRRDG